ncbi:SRPBCC family protein [Pseudomonas borbori]
MSEFDQPLAATHSTADAGILTSTERTLSLVGGGMLLANGLRQRGALGWFQVGLGSLIAARGASGHCRLKQAITPSPWEQQLRQEYGWHTVEACMRTVTIGKPRSEVFALFSDTAKLAQVLGRVERIEQMDNKRFRWTATGPLGKPVHCIAYLDHSRSDQQIVWVSEADAMLPHRCTLNFADAPHGRGTEVRVLLACAPPGGALGYGAASLLSKLSGNLLMRELRRIKQYLETGEVSTAQIKQSAPTERAAQARIDAEPQWEVHP